MPPQPATPYARLGDHLDACREVGEARVTLTFWPPVLCIVMSSTAGLLPRTMASLILRRSHVDGATDGVTEASFVIS